jgi:hypothetical protein
VVQVVKQRTVVSKFILSLSTSVILGRKKDGWMIMNGEEDSIETNCRGWEYHEYYQHSKYSPPGYKGTNLQLCETCSARETSG